MQRQGTVFIIVKEDRMIQGTLTNLLNSREWIKNNKNCLNSCLNNYYKTFNKVQFMLYSGTHYIKTETLTGELLTKTIERLLRL